MKTHEQYVQELKEKHNDRITCIGVYRGGTVEIEHFCNTCKRSWLAKPENLVRTRASGCRLCAEDKVKRSKRTPEQYEKELRDIHQGRIIALDPYETRKKKLTHTCTVCSHIWSTLPAYILNGAGCPACNNKVKAKNLRQFTPTKTHSKYLSDLTSVHFDTIIPLEKYTTQITPTRHQCALCNHIWNPLPDRLLQGRGCPQCNQSHGEKYIGNILQKLGLNYIVEKTFDDLRHINNLRFDFYVPDQNLLIEYDGEQHFRPIAHFNGEVGFQKTQTRDRLKNEYAEKHGIRLIRIPYWLTNQQIQNVLEEALIGHTSASCTNHAYEREPVLAESP